jgi:hypothetical protein
LDSDVQAERLSWAGNEFDAGVDLGEVRSTS